MFKKVFGLLLELLRGKTMEIIKILIALFVPWIFVFIFVFVFKDFEL